MAVMRSSTGQSYIKGQKIGEGGFGEVYMATAISGSQYVMKVETWRSAILTFFIPLENFRPTEDHQLIRNLPSSAVNMAVMSSSTAIVGEIGAGGFGEAYKATFNDKPVVVKIDKGMPITKYTGLREAGIMAGLNHQNVIKLIDDGYYGGKYFFVMEHCPGGNLHNLIYYQPPLTEQNIWNITTQICRALVYIHGQGIIHRDITPHNILLSGNLIKVADFGIALKHVESRDYIQNTLPYQSRVAKEEYMAPEMRDRKPYDYKLDIYGLGWVLWEMVYTAISRMPTYLPSGAGGNYIPLQALQKRLHSEDPTNRPSSAELLIELGG